ncbi:FAD-dependent oxidoreductase [Holdemania massiliensis]|uniref:FAD-dependent oxidoreductase n=1 Tax=Holdemania massiliensis TaxID=1468449 RepID=UPI001F069D0A|nr:FAD-dependent oxidoreductase [Holdemania massiliensis]MCH1939781.1 FAD-dependent oxidoreductase [Holdemania massiliensis]
MKKLICLCLASLLCLAGCSSSPKTPTSDGDSLFKAGTYIGSGDGNNDPITVEVTFTETEIASITIKEHKETAGISDPAFEKIPQSVMSSQSLAVDTVAGATNTSKGILTAIEDCVKQAGGDVEQLKKAVDQTAKAKTEESRSTDVVVVGSGITGMSAALSAKEAGADVVVIEKQAVTGGTTAIAGGYLISIDSKLYDETDFDDSLDTFRKYWDERMSYSGQKSGYPDETRWEEIVAKTGDTVDWLQEKGVTWEAFTGFGPYPTAHNPAGGRGLIDEMVKIAESQGIEVITECKGEKLVIDDQGAVVGIVAETADKVITFNASSVVLATGGISANDEMVKQYSPKVAQAQTISVAAAGSTGDGMTMALEAGAVPFESFFTSICATTVDPVLAKSVSEAAALTTDKQLGVNAKGERFASESAVYYDALGSDMIQDGNAPFYYIYDSSDADIAAILEKGAAAGAVVKADTIEALAEGMKVDAAALKASFDRYNQQAEAGKDEDFGKAPENLVVLDQAPYYAVIFYPTTFGSQGGVLTSETGQVLNQTGEAIPGLFAAGEMSNRYFYNENYVLAASLGLYATTGRIAGTAAAAK